MTKIAGETLGGSAPGDRIKVGECEACGFAGNTMRIETPRRDVGPSSWYLCEICAATPTGQVVTAPTFVAGHGNVLRALAQIGNLILRELRRPAR